MALMALAAFGGGAAEGAPDTEVGIADDAILLYHPERAPVAVGLWRIFGVDVVRIHARWISIAPGAHSPTRPAGFHPGDPGDPRYYWTALDRAVRLVRSQGMAVMLQITGSGPLWSSSAPSRGDPRWKPDRKAFAQFAGAVAGRYRSLVDRYIVWNEPNQAGWLEPQWECRRKSCAPASPHLYRGLVRAAYPAIKAADPGAQVLIGALAPRGKRGVSSRTPMRPLEFLREMACVDRRYQPRHQGPCRNFHAAQGDGLAYHPHGVLSSPHDRDPQRDNARIGDLARLETTLDHLTDTRRLRATTGRFDLYLTEFGYQTFPPDPYQGVVPDIQSRWLAQAAFLAWRDPRVKTLVQYEWRDEALQANGPGARAYGGWQSGLFYEDGAPKPALYQFPHPFYLRVTRNRKEVVLWGQVRPGGAHEITLERRPLNHNDFEPLLKMTTNASGYWTQRLPVGSPADYRFSYELRGPDPSAPPIRLFSAIERVRLG
ncbi:MAG: hypothetical protein QOI98_2558 [Solirubrobacteraceae bacterium]|nr:hypothetical protein [Solirubrobacteraceae bacterium]